LITAPWPDLPATLIDEAAAAEMDWVVRLISNVRAVRAEMNVPAAAKIPLLLKDMGAAATARMESHRSSIVTLARLASIEPLDGEAPKGAVQDVLDEATVILPLAEVIDLAAEKARLEKEIAKLDGEIGEHDRKLANANFTAKAPAAVVDTERQRRAEAARARSKLTEALNRLAAI
jgi:valyl-tRNA synthetase